MKMKKVVILGTATFLILTGGAGNCLDVHAAQIIPPETSWGKVKQIVKGINEDGIAIDYLNRDKEIGDYNEYYGSYDGYDTVESLNMATGYFLFRDSFNEFYRLHIADINNDGQEDHIVQMKAGSGEYFDITNVFTKRQGKFVDIYDEIKVKLVETINKGNTDCTGCDELSIYHGDLVIEKEEGKVFFSLVGSSGSWYDLEDDLETVTKVQENNPIFYTFLWDSDGLKEISAEPRQYTKKTDHDSEMIQEVDKLLLEGRLNELLKAPQEASRE